MKEWKCNYTAALSQLVELISTLKQFDFVSFLLLAGAKKGQC